MIELTMLTRRTMCLFLLLSSSILLSGVVEAKPIRWKRVSSSAEVASLTKEHEFVECFYLLPDEFEALRDKTWVLGVQISAECELDETACEIIGSLPKIEILALPGRVWAKGDNPYARLLRIGTLQSLILDGSGIESIEPLRAIADLGQLRLLSLLHVDGAFTKDLLDIVSKLHISTLALTPGPDCDESSVKKISECKTLNTLELDGFSVTDDVVYWFTSNLKLLSLKLSDTRLTGVGRLAKNLAELQHLGFHDCSDLGGAAVGELKGLSCLSSLALSGCKKVDAKSLLAVSKCLGLRCLDLTSSNCDDELLALLAKLPVLEKVELAYCKSVSVEGLASLQKSETIKCLSLKGCTAFKLRELQILLSFHNLTELNLSGLEAVDAKLVASLSKMGELKTLILQNCRGVSKETIANTRAARPDLTIETLIDEE